jgi:alpha/beta superfamily hydrolase
MPRDLPTPPPERLFLPGPAGRLAATWEVPAAQPLGLVLHLHPHPVHGGTRQNNVVRYGALGSLAAGCAALRIDFRGVGDSEGEYDEGRGEVDDAEAAFRWLQSRHPGLPVFIWGFSFGSRVGLDAAIRLHAEVAGFLAVAWPTNFYAWPTADGWPSRSAFLYGSADQYVDPAKLEHARQRGAAIKVIDGAEHFFAGRLEVVREWTTQFLSDWLSTKNRA